MPEQSLPRPREFREALDNVVEAARRTVAAYRAEDEDALADRLNELDAAMGSLNRLVGDLE